MNVPKHVAGIALFIFIVSVSVFIAAIVAAPLQMIPPVPLGASSHRNAAESQSVSYHVQIVSVDFINRESYTSLSLKRERGAPAPDSLWVYTSFFVPEYPNKSWSGSPVELREPFSEGDEVSSITVTAACPWCGDANAPRAGYYARVRVSTVSSEAAARRDEDFDPDIKTAIPVLVQVERKPRR